MSIPTSVMMMLDIAVARRVQGYKRFNVVGTSGVGKTTFSAELARCLSIPHIEMDALFWKPQWTESDDDEFLIRIREATAGADWILDGNYTRTIPVKWANVECVVWLDYSYARITGQAIARALSRALGRRELWPGTGNRESLRKSFLSKDSIIWWTITHLAKNRRKFQRYSADPSYAPIEFVRITGPDDADSLLEAISIR